MYHHQSLTPRDVLSRIKSRKITLAGWSKGKIYGHLNCASGQQKMSRQTRVFFLDETEAVSHGYRPCAKCMPNAYKQWKQLSNN